MRTIKTFLLLNIFLNCSVCFSQDMQMDNEVKEIIKFQKDSIVQLALKLLNGVSIENFERIVVKTNGNEIFVTFSNPIKYLPKKTVFYSDVTVGLINKTIANGRVSNPISYNKANIPFYKKSEEAKRNIQIVIDALNKSNEYDVINPASFQDNMIIRDYGLYYDVSTISEQQESNCKINKKTGLVYDAEHAHLEPEPIDFNKRELYLEIK